MARRNFSASPPMKFSTIIAIRNSVRERVGHAKFVPILSEPECTTRPNCDVGILEWLRWILPSAGGLVSRRGIRLEQMSHLEKVSAVAGGLLVALSTYLVLSEQYTRLRVAQQSPPVEELANELKQVWADRHIP